MVKKRVVWIDIIKVVALILVIVLHLISNSVQLNVRKASLLIYYCGTISVPLFFMVSGYLLLNKKEAITYKYCINKIIKILFFMLLCNLVFVLIFWFKTGNVLNVFLEMCLNFVQDGYFYHFWYLWSLIIIYLLLPILYKVFNEKKNYYYITITFILISLFASIINIIRYQNGLSVFKYSIIQSLRWWIYFTYFMLGGFIAKTDFLAKLSTIKHGLILLFTFILCLVYEYFMATKLYGNLYAENFYDNLIIIVLVVLFFTFIKKVFAKRGEFIAYFAQFSLVMYMIHVTVIDVLKMFLKMNNDYINVLYIIPVFLLSYLVAYILDKIPILNKFIKL